MFHMWQGSRGRQIRRPKTKKLGFGRMFFLRAESLTQGVFPVSRPKIMLKLFTGACLVIWQIIYLVDYLLHLGSYCINQTVIPV